MLSGNHNNFYKKIKKHIPLDRIFIEELEKLAYGTDASFYRLMPQIIIKANDENEIIAIIKTARECGISVTFRAAGTSLSGQAISDSVLVMLGPTWDGYEILEGGDKIRLQPGIIGARVNQFLAPYGKKIGPDPASVNSASIGGIVSNNASGMSGGTLKNSYNTLDSMRIVFNDGYVLDVSDKESVEKFKREKKDVLDKIKKLSEKVKNDSKLAEKIVKKFKMKNTTGYGINSLVDYEDPIEIIQHLMVGSEGTLGFISSLVFKTIDDDKYKASGLLFFPDIEIACKAVCELKKTKASAAELMDRAALRSVENKKGMPDYLKTLNHNAAALLVETAAKDRDALLRQIEEIKIVLKNFPKEKSIEFTENSEEYSKFWDIRKGLFPSVSAMRASGTTCIIEDVAFPLDQLAPATLELQRLLRKYNYEDAIIYGHALEGNWHFVFSQSFDSEEDKLRYKNFMDEAAEIVVEKYEGALKAEHGTGRNMAPFVEKEWGKDAYEVMKEIKNIFDPENILNPGVIINDDKEIHLKNLKRFPLAHEIIDKCIECGFCEPNCPSRNLTLTPRQRIVVYRELSRLKNANGKSKKLIELSGRYDYFGNQTCATDGLCSLACPVGINTGNLIKNLRFETNSRFAVKIAELLSKNMAKLTAIMRISLNAVDFFHQILGSKIMYAFSKTANVISFNLIPMWNKYMPKGANRVKKIKVNPDNPLKAVYFPTCINRAMGISDDYEEKISLIRKTDSLLRKAGYEVIYPEKMNKLCCGMAFSSKGFFEQGAAKSKELEEALIKASENGKYPVLTDMSPCLYHMKEKFTGGIKLYEPIEFILEFLVDKLEFKKLPISAAIHTTCSSTKMELKDKLKILAEMCAERVIVPENIGCCGWAGDRGFTYPELNESALSGLRSKIPEDCKEGYSTSRTCEIGLSMHSGISYKSIIYLVDKSTKRKSA